MNLETEIREDNRKTANWLLFYHEKKKKYLQDRERILQETSKGDGIRSKGSITDTTGRKAVKLADLLETEKWLALVEEVEERLPWKMQILLRLKRQHRFGVKGKPVRYKIALELSEEVSKRMNKDYYVGEKQIDYWWGKIVEYTARLASKRRLL